MPSLLTRLLSHHQYTLGLAESGGVAKSVAKSPATTAAVHSTQNAIATVSTRFCRVDIIWSLRMMILNRVLNAWQTLSRLQRRDRAKPRQELSRRTLA